MIAKPKAPTRASLESAFFAKYGRSASVILKIAKHIMDPYAYGVWREDKGRVGYTFTKERLNTGKKWPASDARVLKHFLGAQKKDYLWYNAGIPLVQGRLFAVAMLDIDAKHGETDGSSLLETIRLLLPCCKIFAEASTGGKGIHGYCPITFPPAMNAHAIRASFLSLQSFIKKSASTVFNARFDRVNGSPPIRATDGGYLSFGTLAKLPCLKTLDEAEEFIAACSSPCEWEDLQELLGLGEHDCSPHSSYAPSGLPFPEDKEVREEAHSKSVGSGGSPAQGDLAHADEDAFERSRRFAFDYCRRVNRSVDAQELVGEYERAGLATGQRTDGRMHRFEGIAAYLAQHFVPRRGTLPPLHYLSMITARLSQEAVDCEYGRKHNRSRLLLDDVALVYWMMVKNKNEAGTIELPRDAAVGFSRKLMTDGQIERVLDHKRFAAAKRLLCQVGLLTLVRRGRKGAGCAMFRLGDCVEGSGVGHGEVDPSSKGTLDAVPQPTSTDPMETDQADPQAPQIPKRKGGEETTAGTKSPLHGSASRGAPASSGDPRSTRGAPANGCAIECASCPTPQDMSQRRNPQQRRP